MVEGDEQPDRPNSQTRMKSCYAFAAIFFVILLIVFNCRNFCLFCQNISFKVNKLYINKTSTLNACIEVQFFMHVFCLFMKYVHEKSMDYYLSVNGMYRIALRSSRKHLNPKNQK